MPDYVNRNSVRYQGQIPVEVKQGMGLTRNFSTSGIYFVTDQPVALDERLEVVMLLDYQHLGQRVRLHCMSDVVRVEPCDELLGVAVAVEGCRFELVTDDAEPPRVDGGACGHA
ncbi:PilZ domain-containing protein [Geomonas oryzae]|uniref:PilZ domain-containing protein n=1 Tax=Geomonas oryzae TaxID=2364273 RepID=UPI00100ADE78|nr:PilZ domain-containing protein [Geomonas oryzae]